MTNYQSKTGPSGEGPMDQEVTQETLMRFLDGELPPEERRRVEVMIEQSTELRRDLSIYRRLHEDLATISFDRESTRGSIWDRVSKRLARPIGWLLLGLGSLTWVIHLTYLYLTSAAAPWEKLATSAVVIGVLVLFASVIHERYRDLLTDPYHNVER